MKLLIAVDMEGITGVTLPDHVNPAHPEYQRFRHLMTADVNAAIRGALEGGATEIVVSDGHWDGNNILIEELDPHARLNSGSPSPFSMVQGIDAGVQAVFFVGYHARIGTQNAVQDHTWSSARVANVWINDRIAGEIGLNASLCGAFGAPVLLVTGDQSAGAEAQDWLPGVQTVAVKQATGRHAAECLPPVVSQARIHEAARESLHRFVAGKGPAPLQPGTPVKMAIEFIYSDMADRASMLPGANRLDGRTIEMTLPDMPTAYRTFRALVGLAAR